MYYVADLHTHSHYAYATSKSLCLETLYQWAQIKGINVIGTGDFTHPAWLKELKEKLIPEGNGLFRLKNIPREPGLPGIKENQIPVRFCLSAEISSVYHFNNKTRRNHNLVYAPDFETAEAINKKLARSGDLAADGRPTVSISSRDVLETVLNVGGQAHFVPAHAWTPWFSTLGSRGGYDSMEECFRDLYAYIFALETGFSSDPAMNWQWSKLDHLTMISSSDAHSAQKLGREANRFDTEMSYDAMFSAIRTGIGFKGTFEFFPEEGKYSYDGHRNCGICITPAETVQLNGICPVCKKQLTVGVMHRVALLSDRDKPQKPERAAAFEYIIPLPEILSEIEGAGVDSRKVTTAFINAINFSGNELSLLTEMPIEDIRSHHPLLGEAIQRLRTGKVRRIPGYDGLYGSIRLFDENFKKPSKQKQFSLF